MTLKVSAIVATLLSIVPRSGLAQPQPGATELARAKSLLELSRAELSAEQFALLSSRLAQTEQAYVELTTVIEATGGAAATAGSSTAATGATVTGGRALLGGLSELLPVLMLVWPATAEAPGMKEEKPQVRMARVKFEESVKALAEAARKVDTERRAAPKRKQPKEKPAEDRDGCICICGPPKGSPAQRQRIGRYAEWRCRSICVEDYGFKYNEYVCQ